MNVLKSLTMLGAAALLAVTISPSLAQDATPPAAATDAAAAPLMLAKGETITVMADGSVVRGQPSETEATDLMKDMKAVKGCMILMMGTDGQLYQRHFGAKKCESVP